MARLDDVGAYSHSFELPQILSGVKNASRFAIDIGGSLAKLAYSTTTKKKRTKVSETDSANESIYKITELESEVEMLSFVKFETKYIESCLNFIQQNLLKHQSERLQGKTVKVTGGGAYKYRDLITSKLGCQIDKEDELECLVCGCNFLLRQITDEAFVYQKHPEAGGSQYKFEPKMPDIFPYLLVNIGSGVSILKVESDTKFYRVGGTSMGGGTFWGLGVLLTGAKSFDDLLKLAAAGNHVNVDLLVEDIYGGSAVESLGLPGKLLACSMGKITRTCDLDLSSKAENAEYSPSDIAQSLLFFISNDIAQLACLQANLHSVDRIYFGGFFIRGHPLTMYSISYAINYWSQGKIKAMFMRHEGYMGAIGAYLKGAEEGDIERYSWGESYLGSSGLISPLIEKNTNMFEAFQISKHPNAVVMFPFLSSSSSYVPDVVDLAQDLEARQHWLTCFNDSLSAFVEKAIKSQKTVHGAEERAKVFSNEYLTILSNLTTNPTAYGSLTVRSLLDMREQCLHNALFSDIYLQQKQLENESSLLLFKKRISELDAMDDVERWEQLIYGVLAGNIFDWGAKAVRELLESDAIDFQLALDKLKDSKFLCDDRDKWVTKLTSSSPAYKCVAIFCDNSGADVILGILPFARELLRAGTKVILCANSEPVLNDVTHTELTILVNRLLSNCHILAQALQDKALLVMETGQASPCLDLRFVDESLCQILKDCNADLIVLEGMGRAIHTNLYTQFTCDSLKLAVIKTEWLANRLGGDIFSVLFKYETVQ